MKHLYLGLLLYAATTTSLLAQEHKIGPGVIIPGPAACAEPISGYQAHADSVFAPLDKSQIPTGGVYDRVFPSGHLVLFNQAQPDTSSNMHFQQAVYELHAAAYNTTRLPCQQRVADYALSWPYHDTIPIGVLQQRFAYLDSTAVDRNLLYWDSNVPRQLHDVPGRSTSPYLTREVTVAA